MWAPSIYGGDAAAADALTRAAQENRPRRMCNSKRYGEVMRYNISDDKWGAIVVNESRV
jgi:hypothetical protein